MFLLLYGRHVCVLQKDTNMVSLYTKLYKFGWHTSANNARMKNSRDLIIGKVVYISIIYRGSDSWLFSLNGYDFYFDHMTGENREYIFSPNPPISQYFRSIKSGTAFYENFLWRSFTATLVCETIFPLPFLGYVITSICGTKSREFSDVWSELDPRKIWD